ncbi:T7SS effector LXG polymorphic toxin [Carnobacterium maltaromaticum]|uniref:T7SS effector LXG polymorphic toxin n=1 Tax=Carnobacterium maltaromaticum TaxID=2751 RepID=UPI000704C5E8|nr:T7SS effector LXG polymorphic toxin [Carnobacterium maltaromaticum]KRN87406.1 hypothetical protein IV75_GL002109 [Carnobacterium maltaromaticum]MDT1945050.1 LXG domain-containing protein [Carnobacterium maltaromaticum]MDT1998699.1 LXG domain-containing protein [Carnobacterium maltaromaticum]GED47609.1 hypothetical protein CMA01_00190 [Carnobacterium maltaromaticum]
MTKVNIKEIDDYFQDFETEAKNWKTQFDGITKSVDGIIGMDSFEGTSAEKTKNYFKDAHKMVIQSFSSVIDASTKNATALLDAFSGDVDNSTTAIIKSDYVEAQSKALKSSISSLKGYNTAINNQVKGVADITSSDATSFSKVTAEETAFSKVVTDLLAHLSSYSSDSLKSVQEIEASLDDLESALKEIEGIQEKGIDKYTVDPFANPAMAILATINDFLNAGGGAGEKAVEAASQSIEFFRLILVGKITYRDGQLIYHGVRGLETLGVDIRSVQRAYQEFRATGGVNLNGTNYSFRRIIQNFTDEVLGGEYSISGATTGGIGANIASKAGKGFVDALNPKDYWKSLKSLKAAPVIGAAVTTLTAGMSAYENYNDAKGQGLSDGEAKVASAINTTVVDVGLAGASAATGVAVVSALAVGAAPAIAVAAIGTAAGMAIYWGLDNLKIEGKPLTGHIKDFVNTSVESVSSTISSISSTVGGWLSFG